MKDYPVHYVSIPRGEKIAYRTAETTGPWVVLLHGNMSSSVHWQTTMEALEKDFRVIAPDLRGFGDSSYNAPFSSLHELALDVEEVLDVVLSGDDFSLVGWSTGGGVAMEIAADWPSRVTRLVTLSSVATNGYPLYKKDAGGHPIVGQLCQTKEEIAADPVQVKPVLDAYATGNREMLRAIWNAVIYNQHQPNDEEYEQYLTAIMKQRNLVDVDYSLLTFNITQQTNGAVEGNGRANNITCPVVILQGEQDMVVPPAWAAQIQETIGDNATVVMLEGCGHSALTDNFLLFMAELKKALPPVQA